MRNDNGQTTTTSATPDDPNVADGFYALFSPAGAHTFTATLTSYAPDVQTPTVVQTDVAVQGQDFFLDAGQLSYHPDSLAATLLSGSSATQPFTLTNPGGAAAIFELSEMPSGVLALDKGRAILGPFESRRCPPGCSQYIVKPFKQKSLTAADLSLPPPPVAPPYAAGDVIQTWPTTLAYGWGLGYNTDAADIWFGNIAIVGGDDLNYRFLPDGTNTGDTIDISSWVGIFAADMTYNPNTGMLWQVDVGGDDCIHELDPIGLTTTGNLICPPFLADQRGLAYDPTTDVYFAGSWNDSMIYRFAPDGTILEQISVGLSTAGLAYNPDTAHLFVMVNDSPNSVYVLDAANNFALVGQFNIAGFTDFGGAGFEMDCEGHLWAVDQNTQIVYQFESGETTSTLCDFDVPWLSEAPLSGTVTSLSSLPITVNFDASLPDGTDQPGQYFAQLKINQDTPYALPRVPVTMTVVPASTWGKLDGIVSSLGHCDANPSPLKGAEVFLQSSSGLTWTSTTDISGTYKIWLDVDNNPLTATISAPNHLSQTLTDINVTAQITTTQDVDLRLEVPCLGVNPADLKVTVSLGMSRTLPLTLANSGAGAANFEFLELPGGYTSTFRVQGSGFSFPKLGTWNAEPGTPNPEPETRNAF